VENAHVESFHGRLREECLQVSWFPNLFDAQRQIETWAITTRIGRIAVSAIGHRKSSQRSVAPRVHSVLVWGKESQTPTVAPRPHAGSNRGCNR